MADMTTMEQGQQVMAALGYPALPQRVERKPKTEYMVQRTQYQPDKLQALMTALGKSIVRKSKWESLANALAATPDAPSFKGAYGVDVVNPYMQGLSSFMRGFGTVYGAGLAGQREAEMKDQENALKAAQLDAEASKQAITDKYTDEYIKVNDPNAKQVQEEQKVQEALNALYALKERNRQNVAGFDTRFDVKNPDGTINIDATLENYKGQNPHGLFGRNWTSPNSFWGWGESKDEADKRMYMQTLKETQLRNVYDTLRGAGAITEKELETMAKTAQKATNPRELDMAIDEFITNIEAKRKSPARKYTVEVINE